jgi:hypothetical protein
VIRRASGKRLQSCTRANGNPFVSTGAPESIGRFRRPSAGAKTLRGCSSSPTPRNAAESLQKRSEFEHSFFMTADLRPIIDDIANRADDFLEGTRDRTHARAGIEEVITIDYPTLNPPDRTVVIAGVMSVLEDEDFFGTEFVGDPFSEPEEPDEE